MEKIIISNLLHNPEYVDKAFAHLKKEYFQSQEYAVIFDIYTKYFSQYKTIPHIDSILATLETRTDLNEAVYKSSLETVEELRTNTIVELPWLVDQTEAYCKERALYNAMRRAITIMEKKGKEQPEVIPSLLEEALSVSFNTSIGHDYIEDYQERYTLIHSDDERVPFDIDHLNDITRGGLKKKTLNVLMAGTGGCKSLSMCHMAASNLREGYNVLYITLEMSQESIAERIDANLLDIPLDELGNLPFDLYQTKMERIKPKLKGRLFIKEYPTGSGNVLQFRHLLNELKLKKKFTPDIIYVDYLNICSSIRYSGSTANSYTIVKAIAEELRGLAVEFNIPIVSATQVNREGFDSTDVEMTHTSESWGLPQTVDLLIVIMQPEEMKRLGQLLWKQLKSRYDDLTRKMKFVIGVDKMRMKLYDLEDKAQINTDIDYDPSINNRGAKPSIFE